MSLNPGDLLRDRYKIIEQIGRGGFGKTYKAKDQSQPNSPLCVVKEIIPPETQDPQILEQVQRRFDIEARSLARLGEHPQIPKLFAYFVEETRFYLVQEFVEGHDLSEEIDPKGVPMTEPEVIQLLEEVLEVLSFVHEQHIVHRDLKPSNLRRRKQDNKIFLIDFGAVKELGTIGVTSLESILTQAIGTPGYMAAEQQSGKPQLNSDLYALGMICIQALTGLHPRSLPSDPNTGNVIWRYSAADRPLLEISPELEEIINKMTRYSFNARYFSATEALEDVRQISAPNLSKHKHTKTRQLPSQQRSTLVSRGRSSQPSLSVSKSWLGLGVGVILVAGGIWLWQLMPKTCPLQNDDDMSCGEEILLREIPSQEKSEGVAAFTRGEYGKAVDWLEKARQKAPNDPELLIYLNNAKLRANNIPFYTLAVASPLGNPSDGGDSGKEILRGVAQLQSEINQGNLINGFGLRIVIADDYNNPVRSQQIAQKLSEQPDILGVIGHYSSDNTRAALPIYTANNLTLVSPTSTAQTLTQNSQVFFRTVNQDSINAEVLAHYLAKQAKQQKVAVFYNPNSAFSSSLYQQFLLSFYGYGGQVVQQLDLSRSIFDANSAINEAQARGATGLILFPDAKVNPYAFSNALKVIRWNQNRALIAGGDSLYTTDILQERKLSEGIIVAIPWHYLASTNQAFKSNMKILWGGSVSWRTATAYDATRVLTTALKTQTNLSLTERIEALFKPEIRRIRLQQTLKNPNFQTTGATGIISFYPNGDRAETASQLVKVVPSRCSTYGYTFIPMQYTVAQAENLMCQH